MSYVPFVLAWQLAQLTPMCPPRGPGQRGIPQGSPGCPDPFLEAGGWWTVAAVVALALVAIAVVTWRVFRAVEDRPILVPERRSLALASVLLAAAVLLVVLATVLPVGLPPLASVVTVAAFIVGGMALRPRGTRSRGLLLAAATYVALGAAVAVTATAVVHRLAWTPFLPLQILFWPDLLAASLGGYYVLQ